MQKQFAEAKNDLNMTVAISYVKSKRFVELV